MSLQQGVIIASWEVDKREYTAQVGGETVEGLGPITKMLGDNGWEIISVVALESSGAAIGTVSKTNNKSRTATDVLAIFIKRYRAAPGEASAGGAG